MRRAADRTLASRWPRALVLAAAAGARALVLAAAALLTACGGSDAGVARAPAGVDGRPPGPRLVRRVEPSDLFPSDLDLVIRVDVARMNAAIGPAAADDLSRRAGLEGSGDDELLKEAMGRAAVVWIGLRLADIDTGDRVLVAEGDVGDLRPDPSMFLPVEGDVAGVSILERAERPRRSGTARIVRIRDRAVAFISPVEVDSVSRVLRDGPDERRGDPAREGIISIDVRPHRLPSSLERRFPSIGAIIAGVKRVRATVLPTDEGVRLDAEINARNKAAAERTLRFLSALRDNVEDPSRKDLMKALSMDQVEDTIRIRWILSAKVLAALVQPEVASP